VRVHHLRAALRLPGFRRLFIVRVVAQFGDGVFQASLAGAVLFNPERQAHAADVAAGFVVLLLPYSIVGPFAGVLLDRWWRQRVLVVANLLRGVAVLAMAAEIAGGLHGEPFYASALVVLSISRFFLAGLSASLPHVINSAELVTANAVSTTCGALATTAGGAVAIGVKLITGSSAQAGYTGMAAAAVLPYVVSAIAARGFPRTALGPDDVERSNRESVLEVLRGLRAGMRHLRSRRAAGLALGAITVHRLCYGLFAVCTVLLFRNYFTAEGPLRVGLGGLAQVVVVIAVGGGLAALVTPTMTRQIGFTHWSAALLGASGVVQVALVLPYRLPLYLLAALLLGFCAQGIKISVDTLLQRTIEDEYRGRVFAIYDTLFNLALVVAAVLTALALPDDGHAPQSVVVIGVVYVAAAAGYLRLDRRTAPVTAAAATTSG
jgi:MFS family permease